MLFNSVDKFTFTIISFRWKFIIFGIHFEIWMCVLFFYTRRKISLKMWKTRFFQVIMRGKTIKNMENALVFQLTPSQWSSLEINQNYVLLARWEQHDCFFLFGVFLQRVLLDLWRKKVKLLSHMCVCVFTIFGAPYFR
jgi:hypothetical protein